MLSAGVWTPNQENTILFVLVDSNGAIVTGLDNAFTLQLSKNGAGFVGSAGTKSEVGSGWYKYVATAAEADTHGPIAITVTHASIDQQNLEYVVHSRVASAVAFTYTVTRSDNGNPIDGVEVWFTTDSSGANVVWRGVTDAFGIARDSNDNLPRLDSGTYYVWRQHSSYEFDDPDTEVVSDA